VHAMQKIAKRIDRETDGPDLPERPPGMHWHVYERRAERHQHLDNLPGIGLGRLNEAGLLRDHRYKTRKDFDGLLTQINAQGSNKVSPSPQAQVEDGQTLPPPCHGIVRDTPLSWCLGRHSGSR
jgi:hypothetical protein